jgi:UDP-N-acetylglucosamine 2-epimerase
MAARRLPDTRHVAVHIGRHYDWMMAEAFIEELHCEDARENLRAEGIASERIDLVGPTQ